MPKVQPVPEIHALTRKQLSGLTCSGSGAMVSWARVVWLDRVKSSPDCTKLLNKWVACLCETEALPWIHARIYKLHCGKNRVCYVKMGDIRNPGIGYTTPEK